MSGGQIFQVRKSNETSGIPESAQLAAIDIILQRLIPSEQQSAKWGIWALKAYLVDVIYRFPPTVLSEDAFSLSFCAFFIQ